MITILDHRPVLQINFKGQQIYKKRERNGNISKNVMSLKPKNSNWNKKKNLENSCNVHKNMIVSNSLLWSVIEKKINFQDYQNKKLYKIYPSITM